MSENKETVKILIFKLKSFGREVSQVQEDVNKTQTRFVKHSGQISKFDQLLELEIGLILRPNSTKFQTKFTQFSVIVVYQEKQKSGGFVKFDVADIVNKNYVNQLITLPLSQCPDPQAKLQIIFNFQLVNQVSHSLFNELNFIDEVSNVQYCHKNDLSQLQFPNQSELYNNNEDISKYNQPQTVTMNGEKMMLILSYEQQTKQKRIKLNQINKLLDKFQQLKLINVRQRQQKLIKRIKQLQNIVQQKDKKIMILQQKIWEIQQKSQINKQAAQKLKNLQRQLQKMKETLIKKYQSGIIGSQMTFQFQNKSMSQIFDLTTKSQQQITKLKIKINQKNSQLVDLQNKIGDLSFKLAQLFISAQQYGGNKLIDYLNKSIGIVEYQG